MWKNFKDYMNWKQSKRRSPLFSNKTRFGLGFLLKSPLILKPGNSERASFTRHETLEKGEKGLESRGWLPLVVREVPAFECQPCVTLDKLLNHSGLWDNSCI